MYLTPGKNTGLTKHTFVSKVMSIFFLIQYLGLSYIFFPPKGKVSFDFMAAVTTSWDFGAQENKVCHCFHFFLTIYFLWNDGTRCCYLSFWILNFKSAFSLSSFTFISRSFFSCPSLSAIMVMSSEFLRLLFTWLASEKLWYIDTTGLIFCNYYLI